MGPPNTRIFPWPFTSFRNCPFVLIRPPASPNYDASILAGLLIGFSAWTKNEGQVLAALIPLSLLFIGALTHRWKHQWKPCLFFLIGLAPVLVLILYHKILLAPANSFYALNRPEPLAAHLTDLGRYGTILVRFFKSALFFGQWTFPLLPVLILYAFFARLSDQALKKDLFPFILISLQTAVFFLVFLLFPPKSDLLSGYHTGPPLPATLSRSAFCNFFCFEDARRDFARSSNLRQAIYSE